MANNIKIIVTAATFAATAFASSAEQWSLDRCIAHAVENNISVKISEANSQSARMSVSQAKSGYLPNVSANASQAWNLGRGLTSENVYANRNTSTFNWGVQGSLPLFDGLSTPRRVKYAEANLAQIIERYEAAKEDVTINVITAYLQALYTQELMQVARQQVELSEHELDRRHALLDAGKIPEIDLLEAESQLSSDKLSLVQAENNHTLAIVDLAKLLRISDIGGFEICPLTDDDTMIMDPEEAYRLARQYNHSLEAGRKGIEASEANITLSKSGYLPTLSFGTSIGSSYYYVSGFNNEAFGNQMKNNYSTYFGFSLNVPIFDAFNTRNSVRQAKVEKLQAELQYEQAEEELQRTITEAYYQAVGAYNKYDSSKEAEKYAKSAFEAMQEKYNIGRATTTEYEQSNSKYLQAVAERIQSNYELILRSRILRYYTTPH